MIAKKFRNPAAAPLVPFILTFLILSACTGTKSSGQAGAIINEYIQEPMIDSMEIPVYIATNRSGMGTFGCEPESFSSNYTDLVRFGKCDVHVPLEHPVGSVAGGKRGDNPDQLFYAYQGQEMDRSNFFNALDQQEGNNLILFVHGFNVPFQEALFRAAQIKYDLKFPGSVVIYTWPAGSVNSFFDSFMLNKTYSNNLESAIKTRLHFAEFLRDLKKIKGNKYLIVHSMGHQIVLPVLSELAQENASDAIFNEIILNAPDFPGDEFQRISTNLAKAGKRVTLYCSPNDNALNASSIINQTDRAGSCVKASGVDTINVQEVDSPVMGIGGLGHGYYSSRPILTDLYQTILGVDTEKRLFIRKSTTGDRQDYFLRN